MRAHRINKGVRGFSLIEVLVALIVVSVGLLGIAKMQAVAYSSTGVASKRSLAAIEAASLASSMHANRAYWAAPGISRRHRRPLRGLRSRRRPMLSVAGGNRLHIPCAGPSGCTPAAACRLRFERRQRLGPDAEAAPGHERSGDHYLRQPCRVDSARDLHSQHPVDGESGGRELPGGGGCHCSRGQSRGHCGLSAALIHALHRAMNTHRVHSRSPRL
jgi:prepilin-type N-terminal cleavage/methylation domain-containing protein